MKCPQCDTPNSRTYDSRPADGGNAVRRRRLCVNADCRWRWTTLESERVDEADMRERVASDVAASLRKMADRLEATNRAPDGQTGSMPYPTWYLERLEAEGKS